MLTLQILTGWTILGTIGTILLLIDGYKQHAKVLFFQAVFRIRNRTVNGV